MNEPWFNPNLFAWIPGTVLGVLIGLWGALSGVLAPRGKSKALVMGLGVLMLATSCLLLILAVFAALQGQPYGVWYGLGLPGFVGLTIVGPLLFVVRMRYRQAETQRLEAQDL